MDQSALAQLDIIREISEALTCAGVDHWLFGGWAVDFAVGHMTRQHRDVDFVVWEVDLSRMTGLLRCLGYGGPDQSDHEDDRRLYHFSRDL